MATQVTMPKLGLTMEEGTVLNWKKQAGESVEKGEPLLVIETDKVEFDVEAPASGTVLKTFANEGDVIPTGQVIAFIGEAGEKVAPAPAAPAPEPAKTPAVAAPQPAVPVAAAPAPAIPEAGGDGRIFISPLARKLAREMGVDFTRIKGSGPRGRIVKDDILKAARAAPAAPGVAAAPPVRPVAVQQVAAPPVAPGGILDTVPVRGMRKVIAERMARSWASAPHVTEVIDVDATKIVEMREASKAVWEEVFGVKVTYNDILVHQVARTIRRYPRVNCRLNGDVIEILADVNIGVAVNVEGGLIVPVIRNVDQKDLGQIARESQDLARRAREGGLSPDELHGSTFTISNLGGYGIQVFTPIIDLPNSCILGIGKITKTPVVVDGEIAIRDIVYLSLSFDHRIVDGAPAAEFLALLKKTLENPYVVPV
ncbi:MAG: dihydrolipoamide acetyltransferase family protein [Nitrospinota bacterium]